jgi:hypothetical protein
MELVNGARYKFIVGNVELREVVDSRIPYIQVILLETETHSKFYDTILPLNLNVEKMKLYKIPENVKLEALNIRNAIGDIITLEAKEEIYAGRKVYTFSIVKD